MGGGADFNPAGRSDNEVMSFCQSFMMGIYRHISHNIDIAAGYIGIGVREIVYLFGMYKRLSNEFTGVLMGKGIGLGKKLNETRSYKIRSSVFCS